MKPLVTYFGLAYIISWVLWLPLYGFVFGLTNLPPIPYNHAIGGFGPLIASVITTFIYYRKQGVLTLLKQCIKVKPIIYFLVALLSPFVLVLMAVLINYLATNQPINLLGLLQSKEFPNFSFVGFFIYNLVFFGFGEEVGWRGFALPQLQKKYNALVASLILTAFWSLWHWPLFLFRPSYTSMDFAGIFGWIFSLLTGSVLLTWLYNSSRASVFICAVFHCTVDIAFTADLANKNIVNYMGFLITVWGILTIVIFKPKHLSFVQPEKEMSSRL